jgi:hypothetical protein
MEKDEKCGQVLITSTKDRRTQRRENSLTSLHYPEEIIPFLTIGSSPISLASFK